jgi:hypothetical protein
VSHSVNLKPRPQRGFSLQGRSDARSSSLCREPDQRCAHYLVGAEREAET